MNLSVYLVIGLGGAFGAVARYAMSSWISQKFLYAFPWGTFAVNMLGCFIIGIVYVLGVENLILSSNTRLFLSVGFIGAFTTFSTFSLETLNIIKSGDVKTALFNSIGSLVVGLLAVWLGMVLTKLIVK
ncbi:fluoride efflux transporter CrcB [Dehalobacter sp. DCM]|uniref:fluoride efflux transporter CrcB n=1 Tax=Dehalobacter sp. DCM TaxID=2907827 RepID=UPI003081CAF9|nr:fluoride efflux transporter CrcB [Dehalobacter sp. DCM]